MTEEEKDLLLKDLCARLPYNTKVHGVYAQQKPDFDTESDYIEYIEIDGILSLRDIEWIQMCVSEVKPYLFPLSSMTDEQENEWNNLHFNPLYEVLEGKFNGKEEQLQLFSKSMSDPIQWCYKNHFDCNGLIPLGLAIDCTNLNIY